MNNHNTDANVFDESTIASKAASEIVHCCLGHDLDRVNLSRAIAILQEHADLADSFMEIACVSANVRAVQRFLQADSAAATTPCGPLRIQPILYLCFSRLAADTDHAKSNQLEIASLLLQAGADPNAYFPHPEATTAKQTCLYGASGINDNAALTMLLLEHGADPNDRCDTLGPEALYHSCELPTSDCLKLICQAGVDQDKLVYCLGRALDFDHTEHVCVMLRYISESTNGGSNPILDHHFHKAITNFCSFETLILLLQAGVDINHHDANGNSPHTNAVRHGRADVAEWLISNGAENTTTTIDQFVGAAMQADKNTVDALLLANPDIIQQFTTEDHSLLCKAVLSPNRAALPLMLHVGFNPNQHTTAELSPLHTACWFGRCDALAELLRCDVDLEKKNPYGGTALSTTTHAFNHCHADPGGPTVSGKVSTERQSKYATCIRMLLDAGSDTTIFGADVWKLSSMALIDAPDYQHPSLPKTYIHPHVQSAIDFRRLIEATEFWSSPEELINSIKITAQLLIESPLATHPFVQIAASNYGVSLPLDTHSNALDFASKLDGFDDWQDARERGAEGLDAAFERATDAVVEGEYETLKTILLAKPRLVQMRSGRGHRATLLHYVAANGTEIHRQIIPPNHARICQLLLDHGAAPNATCEVYGGGSATTTLGLLKSSDHPRAAGTFEAVAAAISNR